MNKDRNKFLYDNEGIVIRKRSIDDFVSRKISNTNSLFCYNLVKLIENPCIVDSKSSGMLFKIGVSSIKSIHSSTPIEYVTRLLVDYDNNSCDRKLINKFYTKFKDYSFMLYTSWNSTINQPRFRVIIKIKNPINRIYLKNKKYREYLASVFEIGKEKPDESCFFAHQCQLLPIVNEKNKYSYKFIINDGKRLSLKKYEDVTEDDTEIPELDVSRIDDVVQFTINNNLTLLDSDLIKKENEEFEKRLAKIKNRNTIKTKAYKEARELLEKKFKNKKEFKNKNEFLTTLLPKFVSRKKLNLFYDEWIDYYGFDIRDNKKWIKKFNEFLPKVADYCKVNLESLQ